MQQSIALEKQLGELKTRFVSMASHELRTPLATIMATIETLKAYWPKMTEKDIENRLDKIGLQGTHLRKIMNDVLNYSKTTTGKARFEPIVGDLYELINEIVEEFKSLPIFNHQLKLELDQPTLMFEFDVNLMRQIVSNLLSNAFKYTDKGGLVVLNCSPTKNGVRLEIIDEGIGIPENELPNLFDPFFRASNSLDFQGTGLGLSIVKEAVQLHNGTIKAENNITKGTKFIIELPTKQSYEKDVQNITD